MLLFALYGTAVPPAHGQNGPPVVDLLLDAENEQRGSVVAPGVISSPDSSESSPSITADGRTMVFTRYTGYGQQVPYIATHAGDDGTANAWTVRRAPFAEYVYNLSISPDGTTILYRTPRTGNPDTEPVSRIFRVERSDDGRWGTPEEISSLRGTRAGYVDIQPDGSLYLYARPAASGDDPDRPRGIYRMRQSADGSYGPLQFAGADISPRGTTTFSPEVFDGGHRMIVTRAGMSDEEEAELGNRGFYLHRKTPNGWDSGTRLALPYGWDATLLRGGGLLYVDDGDLYLIDAPEDAP